MWLTRKTKLLLLAANEQALTVERDPKWQERYHFNAEVKLQQLLDRGFLYLDASLPKRLQCASDVQLNVIATELNWPIMPRAELISRLLGDNAAQPTVNLVIGPAIFCLTQKGKRAIQADDYLLLADRFYFPDVISLAKVSQAKQRFKELSIQEILSQLLTQAERHAALRQDYTYLSLVLKREVRLYKAFSLNREGVDALMKIIFCELTGQLADTVTQTVAQGTKAGHLTPYEIQELRGFIERLGWSLDEFILIFGDFLDQQSMADSQLTRFEMMTVVSFELVAEPQNSEKVYQRSLERQAGKTVTLDATVTN